MNVKRYIRGAQWAALTAMIISAVLYVGIYAYVETTKINKIGKKLKEKYGLVVRYGNPVEFFVPPLEAIDKESNIRIERVEKKHVFKALEGISSALNIYPPKLVKKYLTAVFVARVLEIDGVTGAAMFANSWIYVAAPAKDEMGVKSYALSLHHELSSLFFYGGDFPMIRWHLANETNFHYMTNQADIIRAAAIAKRKDPKQAQTWYNSGFVSDYGMASMENDVNTFAELAMGDPEKLRLLCAKYPRIEQKKKILVQFYSKLAPEMGAYFKSMDLAE